MKYVMTQGQQARISGIITEAASEQYAGIYLNDLIEVNRDLLVFEHSDGFNLVTIEFEYLQPFFSGKKLAVQWNVGMGGIWVVTKTRVKVFGDGLDNDFHVAGFAFAGKTGPRIEWNERFFLLAECKSGYASLPSVLIKNDSPELGDHNLSFLEYYIAVGVNFGGRNERD